MLDSHFRKYVQVIFDKISNIFIKHNISANKVTLLSFTTGIISIINVYFGFSLIAIVFLWLSGLFDAIDGTIARKTSTSSNWGTFLDIVFDRLIEVLFIIALSFLYPNSRLLFIIVLCTYVICITVFLLSGTFIKNNSNKTFYYQSGITERTETFIYYTLVLSFPSYVNMFTYIFISLVIITIIQRIVEVYKFTKKETI